MFLSLILGIAEHNFCLFATSPSALHGGSSPCISENPFFKILLFVFWVVRTEGDLTN